MSAITDEIQDMLQDPINPELTTMDEYRRWADQYIRILNLPYSMMLAKLGEHQQARRRPRIVHTNDQGNTVITRYRFSDTDEWRFDADFHADGWEEYETASFDLYSGVWVNAQRMMIFAYDEGELTLTVCQDHDRLDEELADITDWELATS